MRLFRALAFMSIAVFAAACSSSGDGDIKNDPAASQDELNKTPATAKGKHANTRFTQFKQGPSDKDLAALYTAGSKIDNAFIGVYRYNRVTVEHKDDSARQKRVKEVMHRYMCSFFDESIDLAREKGPAAVKSTLSDIDLDNNAPDADTKTFSKALSSVLASPNLDVMSGSASGNNTAGEIMGVYDKAHDEIFYFGFTNCGSDD